MFPDSTHLCAFPGWNDPARRDDLLLYLFDRFDGLIVGFCARHRVQEADAEDIAQKLWTKLRPKFDEFLDRYRQPGGHSSFRGWLATCTRHLICDLFRDRKKHGGESPDNLPCAEMAEVIAAGFDECPISDARLRRAVACTRERVLPHNWHAFVECVLHGRSYSDVADEQKRSVGAAKAAVRRVRDLLASIY